MKCSHDVQAVFSERIDGALAIDEQREFDAALARCAACREAWIEFSAGVDALRRAPSMPASPALVAAALAAVDADVAQRGRRGWPVVVSHTVAALLGAAAAAAVVFWWLDPSLPRVETVERVVHVPQIVETIVEVDRPVEVERIVEVEKVVEVDRVVTVDRVVPRGPLIRWPRPEAVEAVLRSFGRTAVEVAAAAASLRASRAGARSEPETVARRSDMASARPRPAPLRSTPRLEAAGDADASLRVHRTADRVSLEMRGTLDQLVPLLIAQLANEDAGVALVVDSRLARLRSEALADPTIGPRIIEPDAAAATSAPAGDDDPFAHWNAWWQANNALIADAGVELSL